LGHVLSISVARPLPKPLRRAACSWPARLHCGAPFSPRVVCARCMTVATRSRSAIWACPVLIYKWRADTETGSGTTNPLDRIEQLVRSTAMTASCSGSASAPAASSSATRRPSGRIHPTSSGDEPGGPGVRDLLRRRLVGGRQHVSSHEAQSIRAAGRTEARDEAFVRCCEEGNSPALREASQPLQAVSVQPRGVS